MRRIPAHLCALTALALPASAAAAAPEVPALGVKVADCRTGPEREQRVAEFRGSMPAVTGSSGLAMRFTLERRRGSDWTAVGLPGFTRWERSAAGAAGFVYDKRVERLAADATYRVSVQFRWTDADGAVLRRTTRRSASCRQPDVRPDLSVASVIRLGALGDGRARYAVQLRNDGLSAVTGTVRAGLAVDGVPLTPEGRLGLGAGLVEVFAFEGPECRAGAAMSAVADPQDGVDEADEADNTRTAACPGR